MHVTDLIKVRDTHIHRQSLHTYVQLNLSATTSVTVLLRPGFIPLLVPLEKRYKAYLQPKLDFLSCIGRLIH
ncbi:unnamed protein product [Periconia digitata]|uniref:Uncharacterized protein n=1 Tax=Periconia digitata TaxID=1303443 RepID=A0A9W4XIZ8_9PLEO|nr:unnamed protein product [Periconia digitata]